MRYIGASRLRAARLALALGLLGGLLAACGPEDGRARGGGPGADVGNHPAQVQPRSKVFTSQEGQP
jgi:hypothetical protein